MSPTIGWGAFPRAEPTEDPLAREPQRAAFATAESELGHRRVSAAQR
jgi:hypothetical protein